MKSKWLALSLVSSLFSTAHAESVKSMDPGHTFYFPTAIQKPTGTFAMKGYYFGIWDFEYTPSPNVSFGATTAVPIGVMVLAPFVKVTGEVAPELHLGVYASGGFVRAFSIPDSTDGAAYFQAGPLFTVGDESRAFTLGFLTQTTTGSSDKLRFTLNASGYYSFTPRFKGILETYVPFSGDEHYGLLGYGIRYGGENISADVGFVIPFYDGMGDLLRYIPLGIPFVSLNLAW